MIHMGAKTPSPSLEAAAVIDSKLYVTSVIFFRCYTRSKHALIRVNYALKINAVNNAIKKINRSTALKTVIENKCTDFIEQFASHASRARHL